MPKKGLKLELPLGNTREPLFSAFLVHSENRSHLEWERFQNYLAF